MTVSFQLPGGAPQSNTCETDPPDGSANQTNDVSGVEEVTFEFGPDAFAHGTVR